jgi:arsenite-transporting ATPase
MVNEIDRQLEMAHRTPGAYEAALFDSFVDVMRGVTGDGDGGGDPDLARFERVVFDTAPTGNTLRLLSLPEYLGGWIDRLMRKRERSVDLFEKAAIGNDEPRRMLDGDPVLARLAARKERFEFAGERLRDAAAFYLVLNPDELSLRETGRSVERMTEAGLTVEGLVANRLTPAPDEDETGRGARYLRERVATERERLERARTELDPPLVAEIGSRVEEVRGDLLAEVAGELSVDVSTP